jgi:tetratricopeptide (TPR) repeat protein
MTEAKIRVGADDIDKLEVEFQADATRFIPLARAYLDQHLPERAVELCKAGIKKNPNTPNGLLTLGMSYYHIFDEINAEKTLKAHLQTAPDTAVAHRALGEIYLERHQEQKAVSELIRALELEPGDRHTRALLQSLNEKIPALQAKNGQPMDLWIPRHHVLVKDTPPPLRKSAVQFALLIAGVLICLLWYNHHIKIRIEVQKLSEEAAKIIPQDNYAALLEAESKLDAAVKLNQDEKAMMRLAAVQSVLWQDHNQVDRKNKLQEVLQWMEKKDIRLPERYALRGLMLIDEGKSEEAEKFITEIIDHAVKQKDMYLNAMIFGVRGLARLKMGKIPEANDDITAAARFSSDSPHYQALLAEVALREGNLSRAAKHSHDALRQHPSHVFSNIRLAYALIQFGKNAERIQKILAEYLDESKHPVSEFSPPMLGSLYLTKAEFDLARQKPDEAFATVEKSIATYEQNSEAHNLAGRLYVLRQDGTRAMREFARAIELDPVLPKNYFDRAESLFALGQKQQAVDGLSDFEKRMKPTVAYHTKKGDLLVRMEEFSKAQAEFQKAIQVDELNPDGYYHLAFCYQKMGERLGASKEKRDEKHKYFNQAREAYENSLILPGGERPEVYRMMGLIYLDSEDFDNAMDKLAKSAMMMQQMQEPSAKIAEVYLDLSRVFKAMGGPEGEKQEKVYLAKAQGLKEGKSIDQVEKEWAQKENPKRQPSHRRKQK